MASVQIDLDKTKRSVAHVELTPELRKLDNNNAAETDLQKKVFAYSDPKDADEALPAIDAFIKRFERSEKLAAVKLARGYWLLKKQDKKSAIEQFEAVARDHKDRPEAGDAELRCGYLSISEKKPDGEVLNRFRKVANGQVASTPQVRLEAMLRCAALYHKAKDLETAEAAYLAIANATNDAEVKAFAQMQVAAITLEKACNGKASFAQARQLCDEVVARFPEVNKHTRATAALMAVETYAREKNYPQVLAREASYMQQYSQSEEAQLAYYWFALAHLETGDAASAKAIVQALLEAKFPTQERFKLVDVTTSAQRLLKRIEEAEKGN